MLEVEDVVARHFEGLEEAQVVGRPVREEDDLQIASGCQDAG